MPSLVEELDWHEPYHQPQASLMQTEWEQSAAGTFTEQTEELLKSGEHQLQIWEYLNDVTVWDQRSANQSSRSWIEERSQRHTETCSKHTQVVTGQTKRTAQVGTEHHLESVQTKSAFLTQTKVQLKKG